MIFDRTASACLRSVGGAPANVGTAPRQRGSGWHRPQRRTCCTFEARRGSRLAMYTRSRCSAGEKNFAVGQGSAKRNRKTPHGERVGLKSDLGKRKEKEQRREDTNH